MFRRILLTSLSFFIIFTIIVIGFIKLNTTAAAEFTDNVLRPILGADTVIFFEKIFFNVSDKIQQITTNQKNIQSPQFGDFSQYNSNQAKGLELTTIPASNSFDKLRGEGVWKIMKLTAFPNKGVMAYTFVRPDPNRPYSIVTIAQIDMSQMNLGIVAGIKEPGGQAGNPGPGKVPTELVNSNKLVAAFDGGFQYKDGRYGMMVNGKTYLPLQNNLGTVVGYKNGVLKIFNYRGQNLGNNVAFIRQNCPILVEDGQSGVMDINNKRLWGRTPSTSIYTWRTGLGLTKNGNLLFAVGNSLTPKTLANALLLAGAQNAVQLDINPNWVRFNIFSPIGMGKYDSKPLTHDLKNGATSFLNGYSKDFFYIYKK